MFRLPAFLVMAFVSTGLLAGCSGNPFDPDIAAEQPPAAPPLEEAEQPATPDPEDAGSIPQNLSLNLASVSYDAENGTLVMRLTSLNAGTLDATYQRTPALDRNGYQAYTLQDDPLDRHVTAIVARSNDPERSVQAGIAADGGQFNTFFNGGFYERTHTAFVTPTEGLVSYAGGYVGQTNLNAPGEQLLEVEDDIDLALRPLQSAQVAGTIFLNVDFAENTINGAIVNRRFTQYGATVPGGLPNTLPTITLRVGDINRADGTFYGDRVTYQNSEMDIGEYGGIFGGTNAAAIGGVVSLSEFDGAGNSLGLTAEREIGTFVLSRCGVAGDDPVLCADVN
jgi:hypothetical protein